MQNKTSKMTMWLKGRKCELRAPEPYDLDCLYNWENDTALWEPGNALSPFSRETLRSFIETSGNDIYQTRQLRLMIVHEELTAGCIDLFDFEPLHRRAGVGIIIDSTQRKKGLGKDALQVLIHYAFNRLHLHQLFCSIDPANEASRKLFTSCGFIHTATRKQWNRTKDGFRDEAFYQLIRDNDHD
jgi:diamine N-acetyltransferase